MPAPTPLEDRFWSSFSLVGPCWLWNRPLSDGYGRLWDGGSGTHIKAHRYSYETMVGPIPTDKTIDHLCRDRACVNPFHMEIVSNRTNVLRGVGITARNVHKTHCPRGHEYTRENTRWSGRKRHCRTCDRAHNARQRAARAKARAAKGEK